MHPAALRLAPWASLVALTQHMLTLGDYRWPEAPGQLSSPATGKRVKLKTTGWEEPRRRCLQPDVAVRSCSSDA